MTDAAVDPGRFVRIGEIVKPVGLRGEFKLYPLLDFFAPLLDSGYLVWDDGAPARLAGHRPAGACFVLRQDGVQSQEEAAALVGRELGFLAGSYLEADFPRPAGGLPFRYLGRPVDTKDGVRVGEVEEVRWTGGQLLLVVAGGARRILIPAVPAILRPDAGLAGPLVVDPPEGLLDVDGG